MGSFVAKTDIICSLERLKARPDIGQWEPRVAFPSRVPRFVRRPSLKGGRSARVTIETPLPPQLRATWTGTTAVLVRAIDNGRLDLGI